jgi:hypothetical protein
MQTDSSNNTIWRTIVLTSAGGILGFFIVRFLFGASSDMQGFVIGIGFGGFGGWMVCWLRLQRDGLRRLPCRHCLRWCGGGHTNAGVGGQGMVEGPATDAAFAIVFIVLGGLIAVGLAMVVF